MSRFANAQEAKEFLVAKIAEEAQREGAPLSEIERKMLYFTETGWTLPDMMQVNDEFERDYDRDEYEQKIAKLVESAADGFEEKNPEEYADWTNAVRILQREDHYLSIPIERAASMSVKSYGRVIVFLFLALVATAYAVAGFNKYNPDKWIERNYPWGRYVILAGWLLTVSIIVAYGITWLFYGKRKAGTVFINLLDKLFRKDD